VVVPYPNGVTSTTTECCPSGIATEAGTAATDGYELVRVRVSPPAEAGLGIEKVMVPFVPVMRLKDETFGVIGGNAFTWKVREEINVPSGVVRVRDRFPAVAVSAITNLTGNVVSVFPASMVATTPDPVLTAVTLPRLFPVIVASMVSP
jgi:hypothetical protein